MAYSSTFAVPTMDELENPVLQDLNATSATMQQPYLGDTVKAKDGVYKYVKYESISNVVVKAGSPAVWGDTTGDYVVQADVSAAACALTFGSGQAGVFCAPMADENDCYVWIKTKGFTPGVRVGATVVANQELAMSTTDLYDNLGSVLSGWAAVPTAFSVGAATDATGGGNSVADVILRCG